MSSNFDYKIKSKPTFYKGISYRSRLEAKWSSLFSQLGWKYQYEPFDLDGWTPDFEIFTHEDNKRILVEVKPIDLGSGKSNLAPYEKAINYSKDYNILLLGVSPFIHDNFQCIGKMLGDFCSDNNLVDYAVIKTNWNSFGVSSAYYSFQNVIGNPENLWHDHLMKKHTRRGDYKEDDFDYFWAMAHNETTF